jgi:hypothetical protein
LQKEQEEREAIENQDREEKEKVREKLRQQEAEEAARREKERKEIERKELERRDAEKRVAEVERMVREGGSALGGDVDDSVCILLLSSSSMSSLINFHTCLLYLSFVCRSSCPNMLKDLSEHCVQTRP